MGWVGWRGMGVLITAMTWQVCVAELCEYVCLEHERWIQSIHNVHSLMCAPYCYNCTHNRKALLLSLVILLYNEIYFGESVKLVRERQNLDSYFGVETVCVGRWFSVQYHENAGFMWEFNAKRHVCLIKWTLRVFFRLVVSQIPLRLFLQWITESSPFLRVKPPHRIRELIKGVKVAMHGVQDFSVRGGMCIGKDECVRYLYLDATMYAECLFQPTTMIRQYRDERDP